MARLDLVGTLTPVYNLAGTLTNTGSLSGTLSFTGIQYLDDLLDVDISMPTSGDVLMYDGSKWVNAAGGGGTSDYDDLTNKPSINSVTLQGNKTTQDLNISYNDLTDQPTIPTSLDDLSDVDTSSYPLNDGDYLGWSGVDWIPMPADDELADLNDVTLSTLHEGQVLKRSYNSWRNAYVDYSEITNTPTIPAAQVNADWDAVSGVEQILNKPTLSAVATSGSYTDLTDTPTIPAAQVNSDWNAISGVAEILNKPSLATVATSGSYNDLTDKPTIPDGLHHYSTTEQQVGVWVDGTTPVYEKTYTFNSTITCSAGNTSAAGAWTSLVSWNDSITIIDFKAWNDGATGKTYWGHLSAQWSSTNSDIRALNIRSSTANVDGFIMRYFYNT